MIGTILIRSIEESPKKSKRRICMPIQKKLARQTGEAEERQTTPTRIAKYNTVKNPEGSATGIRKSQLKSSRHNRSRIAGMNKHKTSNSSPAV